jgi:hemerythrin-like metal-binding protein
MIIWSETFATGIPRVDRDHQTLIAIINELETALAEGRGSQIIEEILSRLARYADDHFLYEEGCMHRHRCAMAAANKQAHLQFSQMIVDARAELTASNRALTSRRVHLQLSNWFVNHVLTVDSSLRGCSAADPE